MYTHMYVYTHISPGRVIASRPVTTETRLRSESSIRRICGGQSGTGTGSPCQYDTTTAPHANLTLCTPVLATDIAINTLNAELNPIRHLLALVGARHIVHVSRIRVKYSASHPTK